RDTRVPHVEHASCDEEPQPIRTHPEQFHEGPQRPAVGHSGAHAVRTQTESHGTDRAAEALRDLVNRFVSRPSQEFVIVLLSPTARRLPCGGGSLSHLPLVARWIGLSDGRRNRLSQLAHSLPAVTTSHSGHELQNLVDGVVLSVGSKLHGRHQQAVDCGEYARVDSRGFGRTDGWAGHTDNSTGTIQL